jgi:hypothetical protein
MMATIMHLPSRPASNLAASEDPNLPPLQTPRWRRGGTPSLVLSAVCPVVAYQLLSGRGVPEISALAVAAVFPAIGTLLGWMQVRRLDLVGIGSLALIAVTIALSLATANPLFLLLKGSAIGGVIAATCLGSLLLPRPAMFYVARHFASLEDRARAPRFDEWWQRSMGFRQTMRRVTLVWGVALAGEALLRVGLVLVLPTAVFLVSSKVTGFGVTLALIAWTMTAVREAARLARGSANGTDHP